MESDLLALHWMEHASVFSQAIGNLRTKVQFLLFMKMLFSHNEKNFASEMLHVLFILTFTHSLVADILHRCYFGL